MSDQRRVQSIRCVALRADGQGCTKWAMRRELRCYFHKLTKAQQVEWARQGGHERAKSERRYKRCPRCGFELAP